MRVEYQTLLMTGVQRGTVRLDYHTHIWKHNFADTTAPTPPYVPATPFEFQMKIEKYDLTLEIPYTILIAATPLSRDGKTR